VKTSDFVARDGQVPDIGPMSGSASVAFTMKPGEISSPIQGGGNGVVLQLLMCKSLPLIVTQPSRMKSVTPCVPASRDERFTVFVSSAARSNAEIGEESESIRMR